VFPLEGLRLGVAERYQMACDFSAFAGQTLYIWNDRDDRFLKAVPMFCYSHLIAKIIVSGLGTRA
jgi:hypothetical protein